MFCGIRTKPSIESESVSGLCFHKALGRDDKDKACKFTE